MYMMVILLEQLEEIAKMYCLNIAFYYSQDLKPNLPDIAYDKAFEEINSNDITKNMEDLNHVKYDYLTNGIPVSYKDSDGR